MKSVLETVSDSFGLPGEVISGAPIIEISGCRSVRIEGHKGIESYDEKEIRVKAGKMKIKVSGSELTLDAMNSEALLISGLIFAVSYEF